MSHPDICSACGATITWAKNTKNFRVAHDPDGTPHKRTCKGRAVHHKSKRVAQDGVRRSRAKR